MRWFQALMPRDEKFFELFTRHAQIISEGAEALRAMLEGGDALPIYCRTVMDRERDADEVTRDVLIAIRRTFITPLDRGDIKDLVTSMDDAIDQMQQAAKIIILYDVNTFTLHMRQMGDVIVQAAGLVREAMPLLRAISSSAVPLNQITEQISLIEGRADEIHDTGLRELYQTHAASNPMAFVVGREMYEHLEEVVDRFDDVGDQISSIVIDQV
jgi:predicted phosphate transport protein (TIGR00153 family)